MTLARSFESKGQAVGINSAPSRDYKTPFRHTPKSAVSLLYTAAMAISKDKVRNEFSTLYGARELSTVSNKARERSYAEAWP